MLEWNGHSLHWHVRSHLEWPDRDFKMYRNRTGDASAVSLRCFETRDMIRSADLSTIRAELKWCAPSDALVFHVAS